MKPELEIATVLVCDDVRKEITNKDILIGVYSGDIVVPMFPAWIGLAVWLELITKENGVYEMSFRVGMSNRPPHELKLRLDIKESKGFMSLALPTAQHLVEEETDFVVEVKEGEGWRLLKRKKVIKGHVRLPLIRPTTPSSPPGDV